MMAGIAGTIGNTQQPGVTERMLEVIEHRGPDTVRAHRTRQFYGGVRTSDLSSVRGDGFARDGNLAILFDGDIYNVRNDEQSDAEVALGLYRKYGRTFAAYLEGVFACAVCDGDTTLLARDTVGVRPLYWGTTGSGDLCFASEAKALVGVSDDVAELPPATTYSSKTGLAGYFPRYPAVSMSQRFENAVRVLQGCLTRAVARRLEDGAVGACLLSGGLDSSIIAAIAKELGADIPLVTVGMEGAPDLENARLMAEHLGMEHHVFGYDAEQIRQSVPRAVWMLESFDEDCVSGTISNLFASVKAREFTNCILSGEGGDELFGGYHLLKGLPTEAGRLKMMDRLIAIAHNTALQRLDRAMMGNSINYRTPFLDTAVIAMSLQIPVRWKIHDAGNGREVEKYILREAFKDLLPEKIYQREKLRFSAGTGTDNLMDKVAEGQADTDEFNEANRKTPEGYILNSPKEMWYYNLFKQQFPAPCFERLVGRWDPGK
ncbi:MAG: asparagine synthase-related protein [Planctomycetota bacterium]|nr:asparagine synthase-related protein [Planctomycetota bacterium]